MILHFTLRTSLRRSLLWQPAALGRLLLFALTLFLTLLIGLWHYQTGLAYEFHVFFILPILGTAWYVGEAAGYAIAVLAVTVWFLTDQHLAHEEIDRLPLLFNSAIRLTMFAGGVWLACQLRRVLQRESRLARLDALTGLANRREFRDQGQRLLAQARRDQTACTAVFIDLDRFKEVNDTLGHEAGDRLLKIVAEELSAHLRASDLVGRLGGDEFALLLPGMAGHDAGPWCAALRERLLAVVREHDWPVTFSIGVASFARAPDTLDELLLEADRLMYQVKHGGRDRILLRNY